MDKGKTICLSFYLIVNPPIRTNVTIQFSVCFSPSVYQIVNCMSMCPSVRLSSVSPPVGVVADCTSSSMLLYRFV